MVKGWENDNFDMPGGLTIGGDIQSDAAAAFNVAPTAGQVLQLDGANCTVDGGVVTVTGSVAVDNVTINGNAITITDTNGDMTQKANGTGDWKVTTPGDSDAIIVDSDGIITYPLQSGFQARMTTNKATATGDGTVYTCLYEAESFDNNADMNAGTGTFTSPVTGNYFLFCTERLVGYTASHTGNNPKIITSNREWGSSANLPDTTKTTANTANMTALADMDAADTATTTAKVLGGTKVLAVQNSASGARSSFSGWLLG